MKTGLLDIIIPGLTNLVDMSTEIFRDSENNSKKSLKNLNKAVLKYQMESSINEVKNKIYNLLDNISNDKKIEFFLLKNHKIHKYIYNLKRNQKNRLIKIRNYLKCKPKFKKFILDNRKSKKDLMIIRKNLMIESFILNKNINGHDLKFYVYFYNNLKTKTYDNKQWFYIGFLVNNQILVKRNYVIKF